MSELYKSDIEIAKYEREKGFRRIERRGFDVISNTFFVEESRTVYDKSKEKDTEMITVSFDDFESYYAFLDGNIYDNACYMFHNIDKSLLDSKKIDEERFLLKKSFEDSTIDDCTIESLDESAEEYQLAEKRKKITEQCLRKINECEEYEELLKALRKSASASTHITLDDFLFNYILQDLGDKKRFNNIMKFVSDYSFTRLLYELCTLYNPADVVAAYDFGRLPQSSAYRYKRQLRDFIKDLEEDRIEYKTRAGYSKFSHYYYEHIYGFVLGKNYPDSHIIRYFESFEEFIKHRKGDLTHCDLSHDKDLKVDFSQYKIDETTKLPSSAYKKISPQVEKSYDGNEFIVRKQWIAENGLVLKEIKRYFRYFFDFVAFLKGDLSGADLILCTGLRNLEKWDGINFAGAKMKSDLCEKFGLQYTRQSLNSQLVKSFQQTKENEDLTVLALNQRRELSKLEHIVEDNMAGPSGPDDYLEVSYISDIHLMHRIKDANCCSSEDVIFVVRKIVDVIASEVGDVLLIGGDVSSEYEVFKLFVESLAQKIGGDTIVIFVLGNHELWSFTDVKLDNIITEYRTLLEDNGMYLLQNDMLYIEEAFWLKKADAGIHLLTHEQLRTMSDSDLQETLRCARFVLFGGCGFAGFNDEFNANVGMYFGVVDREAEIKESKEFNDIYSRLLPILSTKNTTVLTHTPKADWSPNSEYDKNIVYVNGHTHYNFFYDDGETRVYSDNQMGYRNKAVHLKSYLLNSNYDYFSFFGDGIYKITPDQYRKFYRGINIQMTFTSEVNVLYMLKKNGYYCFIHETENGRLTLLNGGAKKRLSGSNIQYYFDNMDNVISELKKPLDKYSSYQNQYSRLIKKLGGSGLIHGCIVDIDFNNHIYINPVDSTVTGYWAADIISKIVYPSVPELLEKNRPDLYDNYLQMLADGNKDYLAIIDNSPRNLIKEKEYFDTEIYKASRIIKKMQRLDNGVLSIWPEQLQDNTRSLNGHKRARASIDQILAGLDEALEKNNLELLEYTRQADPIKIKCTLCGNEWREKYSPIMKGTITCPKCNPHLIIEKNKNTSKDREPPLSPAERLRKRDAKYKQKIAEKSNNSIEVSKYIGSKDPITATCKNCGNVWIIRADHLLDRCHCPKCRNK